VLSGVSLTPRPEYQPAGTKGSLTGSGRPGQDGGHMSGEAHAPRRLLLRFAVLLGAPPAVLTTRPRPRATFWRPVLARAGLVFAPIAVAVVAGFLLASLVLQDTTDRSAFVPQVVTARDAAARLDAGAPPASVVSARAVDLADSLHPFVVVLDPAGRPLASSALLDGRPPLVPAGLVDYARTGVDHHDSTWSIVSGGREPWVMWTPRSGVASAVVVARWRDGFVVAGRSADSPAGHLVLAGALTLVATAAACLVVGLVSPMPRKPPPPGGDDGGGGPGRDPVPPWPRPHERRQHGFRPILRPRPRARPGRRSRA
jgi:hypothetical protein